MIMPITLYKPESFGWEETPKEIFQDDPERLILTRIRRSERELATFLHEWCRAGTGTPRPFSMRHARRTQNQIDAVFQETNI
jgi:hypothetical protein